MLVEDALAGHFNNNGSFPVQLSKTSFDEATGVGFTPADFDGYAQKTATAWADGVDTLTGQRTFTLLPPSGGFRWVAGENLTEPQQIFGHRVLGSGNTPMGYERYAEPISVNNPGDQHNVGLVQIDLSDDALR